MITAAYTPDVYTGNGSTTVFAYNFKIVDQAHIKVEEVVIATGVRTTLDIGTHYSVSGVGEDAGGNVTMVTAPASTKKLVLSLSIPVRQNTNFENQGEYFAEDHEDALDLLTLMVQQAREELDRTPKVTIESGETGDDLIASIEADVAAAAASASAAATSATNAATSATNAATSATNAANSATAAQTAETNAETAETNAAASASAASTSATNAATSASAASTSATNAATSATNAANSATTASTAATNAGNSATAAATSATNAATSATNAATSETNAATSATLAQDWAQKTDGVVSGAGTYSSKEWAVGTQTRGQANGGSAKDWATYTGGTVDGTGYSAKYWAEQAAAGTTDATIPISDVTTNNVSSTKHGWAPKSPGDATKFLNGAATPSYEYVKDSDLSLTDITTNDVSTSKHGFVPKAPNDTTKFLRGDGTWAVLATSSGWTDNGTTINADNNANNYVIGSTSGVAGTSGAGVLVIANGTAPSTSPADCVQLYASDGPDYTTLMLHFDGTDGATTTTDSSASALSVTFVGNAQIDTAQSKFGGSSCLFDGSGDYLTIADNAALEPGTGAFQVEFWVRFNSTAGADIGLCGCANAGSTGWAVYYEPAPTPQLRFTLAGTTISGNWTASTGTWYHIACVRDASNNVYLYADGVKVNGSNTNSANLSNAGTFYIGIYYDGSSYPFNGWIDDLRVLKGGIVYPGGTSFTPPTSALPNTTASSELRVRDEAGNITTLSPHNFDDMPLDVARKIEAESDGLAWAYHSEKGGKSITVDLFTAIREVEKLSGKKLIYTSNAVLVEPSESEKALVKKLQDKVTLLENRLAKFEKP